MKYFTISALYEHCIEALSQPYEVALLLSPPHFTDEDAEAQRG